MMVPIINDIAMTVLEGNNYPTIAVATDDGVLVADGSDNFGDFHRYHADRVREQVDRDISESIRQEIDADILRRVTELAATQPITDNHRGLFRFEQLKDERSEDDQYLGRIGVRI